MAVRVLHALLLPTVLRNNPLQLAQTLPKTIRPCPNVAQNRQLIRRRDPPWRMSDQIITSALDLKRLRS
jgi:hypothetical protein